jgi:hypothetical protein
MDDGELTDEVLPQPWFLPREVSNEILRLLPVPHQDKWSFFFQDWGCLRCDSTKVMHQFLGLCQRCYGITINRLKASILKHSTLDPISPELTENLTQKVRSAKQVLAEMETTKAGHAPEAKPTKRLGRPRLGNGRGTGR